MSIIDTLRRDLLEARKSKDTVASGLLSSLVSEAAKVGKDAGNRESTDDEVVATVKKFIKNAEQTIAALVDVLESVGIHDDGKTRLLEERQRPYFEKTVPQLRKVERELSILESYLPRQMSEQEIVDTLTAFKESNPGANVGALMKHLKDTYPGRYDGKLASVIAKEI